MWFIALYFSFSFAHYHFKNLNQLSECDPIHWENRRAENRNSERGSRCKGAGEHPVEWAIFILSGNAIHKLDSDAFDLQTQPKTDAVAMHFNKQVRFFLISPLTWPDSRWFSVILLRFCVRCNARQRRRAYSAMGMISFVIARIRIEGMLAPNPDSGNARLACDSGFARTSKW